MLDFAFGFIVAGYIVWLIAFIIHTKKVSQLEEANRYRGEEIEQMYRSMSTRDDAMRRDLDTRCDMIERNVDDICSGKCKCKSED